MSDFLYQQYRRRGGELCREEFDERQHFLRANIQSLLVGNEVTIGEFCAVCADVIAESSGNQSGEIAYVFSWALHMAEDIRGVALERENGGNA